MEDAPIEGDTGVSAVADGEAPGEDRTVRFLLAHEGGERRRPEIRDSLLLALAQLKERSHPSDRQHHLALSVEDADGEGEATLPLEADLIVP